MWHPSRVHSWTPFINPFTSSPSGDVPPFPYKRTFRQTFHQKVDSIKLEIGTFHYVPMDVLIDSNFIGTVCNLFLDGAEMEQEFSFVSCWLADTRFGRLIWQLCHVSYIPVTGSGRWYSSLSNKRPIGSQRRDQWPVIWALSLSMAHSDASFPMTVLHNS